MKSAVAALKFYGLCSTVVVAGFAGGALLAELRYAPMLVPGTSPEQAALNDIRQSLSQEARRIEVLDDIQRMGDLKEIWVAAAEKEMQRLGREEFTADRRLAPSKAEPDRKISESPVEQKRVALLAYQPLAVIQKRPPVEKSAVSNETAGSEKLAGSEKVAEAGPERQAAEGVMEARLLVLGMNTPEAETPHTQDRPKEQLQQNASGQPAEGGKDAAAATAPDKPLEQKGQLTKQRTQTAALSPALNFDLAPVRRGAGYVPRVYLSRFPEHIRQVRAGDERKELFLKTVLPLILRANEEIMSDRRRLEAILEKVSSSRKITSEELKFVADLREAYGVEDAPARELLSRVDMVPPSLALAQAAEESGWGTSRFALQGNAIFGQRVYRPVGNGIVPKGREDGEVYRVRAFSRLYDSVRSYMHNLNTHSAYGELRDMRASLRNTEGYAEGRQLAQALLRYSERGQEYVRSLQQIIRINRFGQFDDARLSPERADNKALSTGEREKDAS